MKYQVKQISAKESVLLTLYNFSEFQCVKIFIPPVCLLTYLLARRKSMYLQFKYKVQKRTLAERFQQFNDMRMGQTQANICLPSNICNIKRP